MREAETNGRLLTRIISGWNEDDYRDNTVVTGHQEIGDFTSYIRNYPVLTPKDTSSTAYDPENDEFLPSPATRQTTKVPHDYLAGERDEYRPDNELGIEVVCAYDELPIRGDNPRFKVVSATAVEIGWINTAKDSYDIASAAIGQVNLEGDDLLSRAYELDMSQGGHFQHDDHFVGPYIAHTLGRHIRSIVDSQKNVEQTGVLLSDPIGNLVKVAVDFSSGNITGFFYPTEGSPMLLYWKGPGISLVECWAGARDAVPGERPFFNLDASVNGDSFNRRGVVSFMNTSRAMGDQRRVQRYFASIVGQLEPVDL